MEVRRGLGWLPDIPKPSDYTEEHPAVAPLLAQTRLGIRVAAQSVFGAIESGSTGFAAPAIPSRQDLRAYFSPIEDQGHLGSCTANSAVALLEYFEKRATGKFIDASRLFVYKTERDLLGVTGDTGAYLRTAMEALVLFGAPPEKFWPYDGRDAAVNPRYELEPTAFCYAFASNYQAIKYFRLDPPGTTPAQVLQNIKQYLAGGFPSMFGFPVYSEYDAAQRDPADGHSKVPFPAAGSQYRGGHANVAAGYDDDMVVGGKKGALLVRNSWGTAWGEGGYAWMSYDYVTKGLAVDWWTMTSANWVQTGAFN